MTSKLIKTTSHPPTPPPPSSSSLVAHPSTAKSEPLRCVGFEAQVFRKNRCKKCLRDKSEHHDPTPSPVTGSIITTSTTTVIGPAATKANNDQGILAKSNTGGGPSSAVNVSNNNKPPIAAQSNSAVGVTRTGSFRVVVPGSQRPMDTNNSNLNTTTQTIILSKNSPQVRRASASTPSSSNTRAGGSRTTGGIRRFSGTAADDEEDEDGMRMRTPLSGSLASMTGDLSSDLQSMHTAISGSTMSLSSDATFVSSREQYQDTVEELQAMVDALTVRLEEKTLSYKNLEDEADDLREQLRTPLKSGNSSLGGSLRRRDELHTAQKRIKDLEKDIHELTNSRHTLQIDLEQMRELMDEVNDPDEANQPLVERTRDVLHKLQSAELMCEDLLDENQDLKKELRALEAEMDELHDNFRQDQAMEFQTIQKELELTMKNCRILQFKLRKAERKCDEIESDKMLYEVKLRQMTSVSAGPQQMESGQMREISNELQQTREVNKRLQEEIEHIAEERNALKSAYDSVKRSVVDLEKQKEGHRLQAEKLKSEIETMRKSSHSTQSGNYANEPTLGSSAKSQYDTNQLLRDLYDSVERETDLRDQLNFAEEEANRLRKQVLDMEHDNESLQHQLKKISSARNSGDYSKVGEVLESVRTNDELKLQLDVAEHDISSLKRRLNDTEVSNDKLTSEIKQLKTSCQEFKEARDKMSAVMEEPENSGPGRPRSYYEQKIKLLEAETNDLRKKLVDKERQLERTISEMDIAKRKGGQLNRSKSLDDYQLVDLRRQLQMAEQDIVQLRQKAGVLETDNDRLSADYKRLQFKVGGKRGSTEDADQSKSAKSKAVDEKSQEDLAKFHPDIAVLTKSGKSAQALVDEVVSFKRQTEELQKVISTSRSTFEKARSKAPLKKDVATRQELKTRIDELEKDLQSAMLVAEQESTSAQRLFSEVEEMRSKIQRAVPDLPISDEIKDCRLKLLSAEHLIDTLRSEIKDLQNCLTEERRKTRLSDSESVIKERGDTELRNLKQELSKQRYMVEDLSAKEAALSRQTSEWQKKYLSLKEAYKGDTDAWQKELTDFEQELAKERVIRAAESTAKESVKSLEKDLQSYKQKLAVSEDQIRNLIEAGKLKEKELKEKMAKQEAEISKERSDHETTLARLKSKELEGTADLKKQREERDKLAVRLEALERENSDSQALFKKEHEKLKSECENSRKLEKELQDLKMELEKVKNETKNEARTRTATERQKTADQIKEEVEKLHKQNYELQKQLLDAKRVGDEAGELIARNERKWTSDKEEVNRKLRQDEKIHKAELSAVTMRFENKQKLLEDEVKVMSSSVKQLKKERETLQERLHVNLAEVQKLRRDHTESVTKLDAATISVVTLKTSKESLEKQLDDVQSKATKYEQERNDVKSRAAKDKSSYELRISELQDKLSQYEGQHAKLSAYTLKTRNLATSPTNKGKSNGETVDEGHTKERLEVAEVALKRSQKEVVESKAQITAVQLDKQRECDLLRAKIRELQDKLGPISDAHNSLKLAYDSMRTEYEVVRIDRDDLTERLSENESCQIKERGKIDQILAEIQRLKEVAPLFNSDEDLPSSTSPRRSSRAKPKDAFFDDKSATLTVAEQKKYTGKKSADLQKAIDNITKVSEDIKAERKTRRSILPHKRSNSASIAEAGSGINPPMRRYPSVDTEESTEPSATTLPTPTPLRSIPKQTFPTRNPRFPSIPPSFLVTPPSTMRDNLRSRSYEPVPPNSHGSNGAISEESFRDPGGSWDSIDSDISIESWNYPTLRATTRPDTSHFVSMPNLPEKVDSATSTDDKPRRNLFDTTSAKKKILARLRPLSQHSSKESLQESVEKVSVEASSGFFDRLARPATATQTSRTPSPQPSTKTAADEKLTSLPPASVVSSQVPPGRPTSPYKKAISVEKEKPKDSMKDAKTVPPSAAASGSTSAIKSGSEKTARFKDDKGPPPGKNPLANTWRKPISDLAKKFEMKK